MSIVRIQTVAQAVVGLIFLQGLLYLSYLTWSELARLLLIYGALFWLAYRNRHTLINDASEQVNRTGVRVLAATLAFTLTQFDPNTSVIGEYVDDVSRVHSVLWVIGPLFLFLLACLSDSRNRLNPVSWAALDRTVVAILVAVILMIVVSNLLIGGVATGKVFVGLLKLFSYACLWISLPLFYERGRSARGGILHGWKGAFVACSALFLTTLAAGSVRVGSTLYHYSKGQEAFAEARYEGVTTHYFAFEEWNRTLRIGMLTDRVLSDMATMHFLKDEAPAARSAIQALRSVALDRSDGNLKEAAIHSRSGRWSEAAILYERVLNQSGNVGSVLNELGNAYFHLKDHRRFLDLVKRYNVFPSIDADSFDDLLFVGNINYYRGRLGEALTAFQGASVLQPNDGYAVYKVGVTKLELGSHKEAIVALQKAVALSPTFADAHFRLGVVHEALGDTDAALASYRRAVELLPTHLEANSSARRLGG